MTLVFVKDAFVPEEQATLDINERGCRLGDGMFETMRITNGEVQCIEVHFKRIIKGLDRLLIKHQYLMDALPEVIQALIDENKVTDGFVRVGVSRGIGSVGWLPTMDGEPTLIVQTFLQKELSSRSINLAFSDNIHVPGIGVKTLGAYTYIQASMEAASKNVDDVIMCNEDGYVCETSCANIFWQKHGVWYTPSLELGIIDGVTRRVFMQQEFVVEGFYTNEALQHADAICVSNVRLGVVEGVIRSFAS